LEVEKSWQATELRALASNGSVNSFILKFCSCWQRAVEYYNQKIRARKHHASGWY